jgi:hypothetical protein
MTTLGWEYPSNYRSGFRNIAISVDDGLSAGRLP